MSCPDGVPPVPPLQLPITNNTVTPDGKAVAIGIQLGIGTPQQIFSLKPATSLSDLFLFNIADCGSLANDSCIGPKGGVYDPGASSSYVQTTSQQWNGSRNHNLPATYFNDILHYGSSEVAWDFPAFLKPYGLGSQSGLPLSPYSTFLKAVHEAHQAPSTAYGLWIGSERPSAPADGLLVIGGYDQARVDGDWTSFPYNASCFGCLTLTEVYYESSSGKTSLFDNSSQTLEVLMEPFSPGMFLPGAMIQKFASLTGATYIPEWLVWGYNINNAPSGNISMTFSTGFKTTINSADLFRSPRAYNGTGIYHYANPSEIVSTLWNDTAITNYGVLGQTLLSNYMMLVNHQTKELKLAPAKRDEYLTPKISPICAPLARTTPSAVSTPVPVHHSKSNHAGAIAGGVVSGALGLALIALGFWFLLRRRRRNRPQAVEIDGHRVMHEGELAGNRASEMSSNTNTARHSELNAASKYELSSGTSSSDANELGTGTGDLRQSQLPGQDSQKPTSDRHEMP